MEPARGIDLVNGYAPVDAHRDDDANDRYLGLEQALEQDAPVEGEPETLRSGRARHSPVMLMYEDPLTDGKDADVTGMLVAHEIFQYEMETRDEDLNEWKTTMHDEM